QKERQEIAHFLGSQFLVQALRHDRLWQWKQPVDPVLRDCNFLALAVSHPELVAVAAQGSRQGPAIFQVHQVRKVIRIEGGAGKTNIAQDRIKITVDQVGKVRPDQTTLTLDLVTAAAQGFVGMEDSLAPCPVAPLKLWMLAIGEHLDFLRLALDPGKEKT